MIEGETIMRIDFHYYATYVAARLAGYELDEAQTIAHAAQYVDDSNKEMLINEEGSDIDNFTPTVHEISEILAFDTTSWSDANLLETYKVWMAFHFLPGNYGRTDTIKYSGPVSGLSPAIIWRYNQEADYCFKLLCLPDSLLVKEMINDLVFNHSDNLHFIGLRMHVLADTWAHRYFAGMPAWYMNDIHSIKDINALDVLNRSIPVVTEISKDGERTPYIWVPEPSPMLKDWHNTGEYIVDAPNYNSYVYHGHGRSGHLPDYAYLKYEYKPRWSNKPIVRDNRSGFLKAFKQLLMAMQCIRQKVPFETESYAPLDDKTESIIKDVFHTRYPDQSNTWLSKIPHIHLNGAPIETPEPYQKNKWLEEHKRANGGKNTSYYKFNQAAVEHLKQVTQHLEKNDLFILSGEEGKNTITVTFRNEAGQYIGESSLGESKTHHFATVNHEAVDHKIIKLNSGPLRSGDIVQIKTTDKKTGHKAYLGAWKDNPALYYYKQDFRVFKQRWELEKVDVSLDDIIRNGDKIRIKNLHFESKPYMSSYIHQSLFGSGSYLRTQRDAAEWYLEGATMPLVDSVSKASTEDEVFT